MRVFMLDAVLAGSVVRLFLGTHVECVLCWSHSVAVVHKRL
jgi:hypothetical protein